jgi:hypothetical protein
VFDDILKQSLIPPFVTKIKYGETTFFFSNNPGKNSIVPNLSFNDYDSILAKILNMGFALGDKFVVYRQKNDTFGLMVMITGFNEVKKEVYIDIWSGE